MPAENKEKELRVLKQLLGMYNTIGLVDMLKMPAKQLQEIKKNLGNEVVIKISKKSLLKMALEESRFKPMIEHLPKQPALILSNSEPFAIFKKINSMRFKTYAKEGDVALSDVAVQPGPTELLPGPAISELQKVGIIAGVEGGKIAVKKASTILKRDAVISKDLAGVLRKLKIQAAEVKLKVDSFYDGMLYPRDVLEMVETYPKKLGEAIREDLMFSINIGYPTKENIKYLIAKVNQQEIALKRKLVK
ncbi:MAG: 50S ribosomal protein L10 [Candidatus Aenigmarchaeota archaeon]|nr:50S ribosomal protein L10 [Candidatus Aenigmarchaeota archaeon]